jgi:hypothetical protein
MAAKTETSGREGARDGEGWTVVSATAVGELLADGAETPRKSQPARSKLRQNARRGRRLR